jgi:cell division protein FtsQ
VRQVGRIPEAATRRDPAPSRLRYRLDRLWLTPLFRRFIRLGLPLALTALSLTLWLGDADRRADLYAYAAGVRESVEERPEFMVTMIAIDGASPVVAEAIRDMLPVSLPVSSLRLDLEALRATLTAIDAVQDAQLRVRAGGILQVDIAERVPAILWRTGTSVELLDATGHRVATLLNREARPDLPLIAGEGADRAAPEALALYDAAGPILPRLRGLVRMGERRWDIVLDRGQRILLPEENPVAAVARIVALDSAEDLLNRDITSIDLRNADRPTIRLAAPAAAEFRRVRAPAPEGATE